MFIQLTASSDTSIVKSLPKAASPFSTTRKDHIAKVNTYKCIGVNLMTLAHLAGSPSNTAAALFAASSTG